MSQILFSKLPLYLLLRWANFSGQHSMTIPPGLSPMATNKGRNVNRHRPTYVWLRNTETEILVPYTCMCFYETERLHSLFSSFIRESQKFRQFEKLRQGMCIVEWMIVERSHCRFLALLPWCSFVCAFVCISLCLSETDVHCDHILCTLAQISVYGNRQFQFPPFVTHARESSCSIPCRDATA